MNKRTIFSALILISFGITHLAYGAQPLDELKGPIEQVINILRDPQYKDASQKDLQREKMWEIARKIFDFEAIARGTLTRFRWDGFTPGSGKNSPMCLPNSSGTIILTRYKVNIIMKRWCF